MADPDLEHVHAPTDDVLEGLSPRDGLILEHIPLLRHIVGRMTLPGCLSREDMEGYGMFGLIAAADSFDASRGLEIAAKLSVSLDEVDEILHSARTALEGSLDELTVAGSLASLVADPKSEDPVGSAEWNEMKSLLVGAIQSLPDPDRTVITLYYGEEMLLRDISEILGVTESRVSQIHSRALYRLNRELATRSSDEIVRSKSGDA